VSTPLPHSSSSQSLHTPSSPLKTPREEEDVESSGEDTTNRGTQDDDDLFNQVTGDYDKIVEFNAELYIPARTAVENGNLDGFNAAVAKMPGVNMQDPNDEDNTYVGKSFWALRSRLLHWAVAYNRLDMVRTLLRRGARNLANNVGKTPLEIAKETYSGGDSSFFEVNNLLIAGLRL
jgi:ankyrin repeat protein